MATFTTGPVVTDRAVLSLVVQIQNDTNSTVPFQISDKECGFHFRRK